MKRFVAATALTAALVVASGCGASPKDSVVPLSVGQPFRETIDLAAIRLVAVQDDGRVKTFDALARETLARAFGPKALGDADPVLAYLDLMLVPENSTTSAALYAPKKAFRQRLVQIVRESTPVAQRRDLLSDEALERFLESGYCSAAFLDHPTVREALGLLDRDLMSGSKEVQKLLRSRQLGDGRTLQSIWRVVPPPGGTTVDSWLPISGAAAGGMAALLPSDDVHKSFHGGELPSSIKPETKQALNASWAELQRAWRFQDAAAASNALDALAQQLGAIEPALYPSSTRRGIESWYLRMHKLTWAWLIYLAALVPLLFGITRGRPRALRLGFVLFACALALHTAAIGLRWYIAGRIPNSNMFEAVCASAWFGAVIALVLERLLRRHRVRGLPALAAAVTGMTALMAGSFLPVGLSGDISPVMPILDRTVWLYIHTNVVITSYALIFCAGVVAALSLATRWSPAKRWASATGDTGLLETFDGATMIFLQLAFVALWVGTVLGAVWADVSWGRPWGWDPKEVFALNTWLVFLMLIHVRLRARDKAFWTAVLALVGCAVMLFNWIAVNFVIVGLHSYA